MSNTKKRNWSDDITAGQRVIEPTAISKKYDFLFPQANKEDKVLMRDAEVQDTVKYAERIVHTYLADTKKLAQTLRMDSVEDTLKAIWTFLYHKIQYKLDDAGLEQLRRPARSWADRDNGIDCDDFSIFASSILTNLQIPHSFRITKYNGKPNWQHIYIVVPKNKSADYWTLDAVLGEFDYEKPFSEKKDYPMNLNGINVALLSGIDATDQYMSGSMDTTVNPEQYKVVSDIALNSVLLSKDLQGLGLLDGEEHLGAVINIPDDVIAQKLYRYLVATRQAVANNRTIAYASGYNHQELIKMLDYVIMYWNTDKRDYALGQLIYNEDYLNNLHGIGGIQNDDDALYGDDDMYEDELGSLFKRRNKADRQARKTKRKAKRKAFFKKVGGGLKKVGKGLVRFNPATIAIRNGLLMALRIDFKRMSSRLKWAYATPQQIAKAKVSASTVDKAKRVAQRVENLFTKLGGKRENMIKAIMNARRVKGTLNGLGQLGIEPATTTAIITAASGVIIAILQMFKKEGMSMKGDEDISHDNDPIEIPASQNFVANQSYPQGGYNDNYTPQGGYNDNYTPQGGYNDNYPPQGGYNENYPPIDDELGGIGSNAMTFATNNPLLTFGIIGLGAYGLYHVVNGDKKQLATNRTYRTTRTLSGVSKPRNKATVVAM